MMNSQQDMRYVGLVLARAHILLSLVHNGGGNVPETSPPRAGLSLKARAPSEGINTLLEKRLNDNHEYSEISLYPYSDSSF